jgi:hypothetical protein
MKKNIIFSILISISLLIGSCDSYLDKSPSLSLSADDIYSSQSRIEGVILGIYSLMKNGNKTYVIVENIGDDMINVSGNVSNECLESYEMSIGQNSTDNSTVWNISYRIINNINTALANLDSHTDAAGDKYELFKQELKFQRALVYFYLNFLYSQPYSINPAALSVPLRLQAESSLENENLARSTNAEVYAQILKDTEEYDALPSTGGNYNNITRASRAAVLTLRQRIFMALGNWESAIKAGESISGYSLTNDAIGSFLSSQTCPEIIFTFPQSTTDYGGGHQQSVSYFLGNGKSLVLDRISGIHSSLYPNYNLDTDERISQLIVSKLNQYIVNKYTDDTYYQDWVVIFRYAEVKLNLAESYYNNGQEDAARRELSDVRRRSISEKDDPVDISSLRDNALKEAISLERRTEFVGEAIRAIDIKRRGENFVKQKGVPSEKTITPATGGYTWSIPAVERINNSFIVD